MDTSTGMLTVTEKGLDDRTDARISGIRRTYCHAPSRSHKTGIQIPLNLRRY